MMLKLRWFGCWVATETVYHKLYKWCWNYVGSGVESQLKLFNKFYHLHNLTLKRPSTSCNMEIQTTVFFPFWILNLKTLVYNLTYLNPCCEHDGYNFSIFLTSITFKLDCYLYSILLIFPACLMAVCSFILSGLQGKYAFYAVIPVSLTFGMLVFNFFR